MATHGGYKPSQRQIDCRVLTTAGWLEATFHVLEKGRLIEQLEAVSEFFKVTGASLEGTETRMEFFALQRDATVLVIPPPGEHALQIEKPNTRSETVFCMFPGGLIEGRLRLREGIRLSDYVTRQDGLILLQDCTLHVGPILGPKSTVETHDAVVVNVAHLIGISDSNPM